MLEECEGIYIMEDLKRLILRAKKILEQYHIMLRLVDESGNGRSRGVVSGLYTTGSRIGVVTALNESGDRSLSHYRTLTPAKPSLG